MNLPIHTVAVIAGTGAVIGAVALYLIAAIAANRKKKKKRRERTAAPAASVSATKTEPKKPLLSRLWSKISGIGTMNVILIICGVALFAFTQEMIELFKQYGMVPDTLITCFFAALTGECGVMGWIKTNKEKHRDRKWQKEDMREANMAAQMPAVDPSDVGTPKE